MNEYSVIIAVGEIGKPVVDSTTMEMVGISKEHIILKIESDPEDLIQITYISTGSLDVLGLGIDELDPGVYRARFKTSSIQKASISLDEDNEFDTQGPDIMDHKIEPSKWPITDTPKKKSSILKI